MNAHAPITAMNAEAIHDRLAEITRLESLHAARDLDTELAEVMRMGGNVDALEEAHLQAERAARRLRVERQALEAELPAAVRRSGVEHLDTLRREHERDTVAMDRTIDELVRDWAAFWSSFSAFRSLQDAALTRADQVLTVASKTGATMPDVGNFGSRRVEEICLVLQNVSLLHVLASVGTAAVNGKTTVLD